MPTDDKCDDYSKRITVLEVKTDTHITHCAIERQDIWDHMKTITGDFKAEVDDINRNTREIHDRIDSMNKIAFTILASFAGTLMFVIYETVAKYANF